MRILLTTFPAIGHLHAIAPFALAAKRTGHQICLATSPDLVPWAITCGLPARTVGPTLRSLATSTQATSPTRPNPPTPDRMLTELWPRAVVSDLLRLAQEWKPDLIVHEEGEFTAVLVADRLGLPCVTHSWATPARLPRERAELEARLAPLWSRHAGPHSGAPRISGDLYLDSCPAPFQLGGVDWVEHVVSIRPETFDGPPRPEPGWLGEVGRPSAYITLGSDPQFSVPDVLTLLVTSLADIVHTVIVTTGPNPPSSLGALPPNAHAIAYLPQSQALARVNVVVSQGGAGPTFGALLHALPHLVVPGRSQSQQDVASVSAGIGTGLRLRRERLTPEAISDAVGQLLSDVRFELAASRVRRHIEALPGAAEAVEVAVALVG